MDALHTQLSMINIPFDIIDISETNHQINNDMHSVYTQPSKSSYGGCATYVRSYCWK